jgi:hypothetical protein
LGKWPQIVDLWGEKTMRQFSVGEVVTWIPDVLLRSESHGDYRIVAAMPDRDGEHVYRIKSPLEEYERVVKEDLLVRSNSTLPEEVLKAGPRPRSITLAHAVPAGARHAREGDAAALTRVPAKFEIEACRKAPAAQADAVVAPSRRLRQGYRI